MTEQGSVNPRRRAPTPDQIAVWRDFLATHAALTRRLDEELAREHGISLTEYEVLLILGRAGRACRISELSDQSLLTVSGLSRLVDRLVAAGLVVKERCEDDRRGSEVSLTAEGRSRLRGAGAAHLAGIARAFVVPLGDELEGLRRALDRLTLSIDVGR